jgi:predicted nucleotidyltransferase
MGLDKIKNEILAVFLKHIPKDKCAIFLFGSFAKKEIYPSSDIDIGVVCAKSLTNSTLVKIKQGLREIRTLRDIDVVDFSSSKDKNFLKTALKEVRVWHQTPKSRVYLNNLKKRIKG